MRNATPEQKAAAKIRREKFYELAKKIAELTEEQRMAMAERLGRVPTCEGHVLSVFNTCLLLTQNPAVSMVGGFQQWKRAGRAVRKGEHGLCIWIPKATKDETDLAELEKGEMDFLMGIVFDISQTEPSEAYQRDNAPMVKPQPKGVSLNGWQI